MRAFASTASRGCRKGAVCAGAIHGCLRPWVVVVLSSIASRWLWLDHAQAPAIIYDCAHPHDAARCLQPHTFMPPSITRADCLPIDRSRITPTQFCTILLSHKLILDCEPRTLSGQSVPLEQPYQQPRCLSCHRKNVRGNRRICPTCARRLDSARTLRSSNNNISTMLRMTITTSTFPLSSDSPHTTRAP
jgi:hypothetical protein